MRKSRHPIVVNWYLVFASFAQLWGKNSQTKADHNIRELEASNCTQDQKTHSKHPQSTAKGNNNRHLQSSEKKCLKNGEEESQLRKTSQKSTKAGQHQATMAQTAARKSHNLKVVSSILTCRKFSIFVL